MKCVATVICLMAIAGTVRADDKPNPNGAWKYSVEVNGQSSDVVIKLKLDGDKLTGTVTARGVDTKIEDASYKDGEVSFTINPEIMGNKLTIKYKGKIKGDTFSGKRDIEVNGQTNTREFEAKRSKD